MHATVTSKGQITLPKAVRDRLRLEAGDRLDVDVTSNGSIMMRKRSRTLDELIGCLGHLAMDEPVTQEDIDDAVSEGFAARSERSRR